MSSSNDCFLTCIHVSQEAGQVVWYSHLFQNFPQFLVIHTVKGLGIVNKAETDIFSGTLLLFRWSSGYWQFNLWFFLKPAWTSGISLFTCCWSLACRILSITLLVWSERNCAVVWSFFGIAFHRDWNKNDFPILGHCWVFQICWHVECSTFTASSFRIWSSSPGIPSPPLALFEVMLPKAHLTFQDVWH